MKVYLVPNYPNSGANDLTDVPLSALFDSDSWPRVTPPQSAATIIEGINAATMDDGTPDAASITHWTAGIDWNVDNAVLAGFADKTTVLTNLLRDGVGKSLSDFNLTDAQVATAVAQIFVNDNPNNFTASDIWGSLPWNLNAEHKVLPGYTFSSEIENDDDLSNKIVLG